MKHAHKKKILWASVASSMAVVVGLWGVSLRSRIATSSPAETGAALNEAFAEFNRASTEFGERFSASREQTATATPESATFEEFKQRVIEYGDR